MSTDVVNKHTTIDTGICEKILNGWSLGRRYYSYYLSSQVSIIVH